jgi:hypothetical protein
MPPIASGGIEFDEYDQWPTDLRVGLAGACSLA